MWPSQNTGAVALAMTLSCLLPRGVQSQERRIVFERETIRIVVRADTVRVAGTYRFRNDSALGLRQKLLYPFPVDSLHPFPHVVTVYSEADRVPFEIVRDGIVFPVDVPAKGTNDVTVVYEQTSLDSSICYILTSTTAWQSPLERAEFTVVMTRPNRLTWMAYEPDEVENIDEAVTYRFTRTSFLPREDLCLRWSAVGRSGQR
jgi:hypothetical protein